MQKIKKNDMVQVVSGNEVGARGEVKELVLGWQHSDKLGRKVRTPDRDRVIVTGVNIRKKHQRRVSQRTQTGIIEMEAPVHISNVMLVCPHCDEATRVGFTMEGDKKVRACKRCGGTIN